MPAVAGARGCDGERGARPAGGGSGEVTSMCPARWLDFSAFELGLAGPRAAPLTDCVWPWASPFSSGDKLKGPFSLNSVDFVDWMSL